VLAHNLQYNSVSVQIWYDYMTLGEINVLVGQAEWAWRDAIRNIFAPRGVNSLIAANAAGALDIIERRRIHAAIVDMDSQSAGGLGIVRVIRRYHPLLPCIMVSKVSERRVLGSALELDVFGVVAKPVDMQILQEELNRLFVKKYNSMVFQETV